MSSALQVNPSIMTRSHHGFVTGGKIPSANDLSLRRHQLGVFSHTGHGNTMHPYATTYERFHQFKYAPEYGEMQNHMNDAPSGATHNNVATTIIPKDDSAAVATARQRSLGVVPKKETDPTIPQFDPHATPSSLENHMGERVNPYPFVSDYKDTFVDPNKKSLNGTTVDPYAAPIYKKDFKTATHAIAPPFCSDSASQEEHIPFSGSGYTTGNGFAHSIRERQQELPVSHYKKTFLPPPEVNVPVLADGSVQAPSWRDSNGYLRNGDTLPRVHQVNEGSTPWEPTDYESHAKGVQREGLTAPRPSTVPTRIIQRAGTATNQSRRRRIEESSFSRAERGAPTDGLGTEHMKLHLGSEATGLHHLSTRPHTAGYEAAPHRYHSAHYFQVAPINQKIGTGLEESQQLSQLRKLRRSSPADYQYELHGAPRYRSTYSLLHNNKWEENNIPAPGQGEVGPNGISAGWGSDGCLSEPTLANGGIRNVYETSYQRQTRDAIDLAKSIHSLGKTVALPQDTGYIANEGSKVPLQYNSRDDTPKNRYVLTSHTAFQHPTAHAERLPAASGSQVNMAAPLQSSYAREGSVDYIFPHPAYNTIKTLDNRTVVVKAKTEDLHPTVIKALQVKESAPVNNWGGKTHPLVPLVAL